MNEKVTPCNILSSAKTVGEVLKILQQLLRTVNLPVQEARWILAHCLQVPSTTLEQFSEKVVTQSILSLIESFIRRRCQYEPLAYVLGSTYFGEYEFFVGPGVLVPRPETEILVELATRFYPGYGNVLDLCTGCGCIPISLALKLPSIPLLIGTDISPQALIWAQKNCEHYQLTHRIHFICADLFSSLRPYQLFSLITANPPYVAEYEKNLLSPEVFYEPSIAIDGGPDGLSVIRKIVISLKKFLEKNGVFICEVGWQQACQVRTILYEAGLDLVDIFPDQQNIPRFLVARYSKS